MTDSHAWEITCHRLTQAKIAAHRTHDTVQLLAVSKTQPSTRIRELFALGQRAFGENYVQEWAQKTTELSDLDIEWHFIGPLQSNKTRIVAERAHWLHSVDRLKIAERLAAQRPTHLPPLNVCIQVNVSGEANKSGVVPAEVATLAYAIVGLPHLKLRGLMCIPEATDNQERLRAQFAALRNTLEQLNAAGFALDTLSMGMSADLELAVAEGSTLVRVGSAIFGARPAK